MKHIIPLVVVVNLFLSADAFAPSLVSSTRNGLKSYGEQELKLHPDQAQELEEAAKQWLDAASRFEDEQNDLMTSKPVRALGTPLSASGSGNKANKTKWWSRAFSRLVRRNIAGHR